MKRALAIHAGAALLFIALAAAMLWPLPRHLATAASDPGDPYLNAFILDWAQYAMQHGQPLFDAPIFHPNRNSYAFSEHLLGLAVIAMPFRAMDASPLTQHNLLLLLGFAFAGYAAFVAGTFLTNSYAAGVVAGIAYAFLPWRFTRVAHVQDVWTGWLVLLFVALMAYAVRPNVWRAAAIGATFLMNGLTNLHWFAFGGVMLGLTAVMLVALWPRTRSLRCALQLLAAIAIPVALLWPLLWRYHTTMLQYHMRGDAKETLFFSAQWPDWLLPNFHNRFYLPLALNNGTTNPERWLFPGLGIVILACLAFIRIHRSKYQERLAFTTAMLWIVIGAFGALGLHGWVHTALFDLFPFFRGIRVPARWAAIVYVGLAMLAAMGTLHISGRSTRRRVITATIIAIALLIELHSAPIRWYLAPTEDAAVYHWLATLPKPTHVIELPFDRNKSEYRYVLASTIHHQPLLNGVSGFSPPTFHSLSDIANATPMGEQLIPLAKELGADIVIVHADDMDNQAPELIEILQRALDSGALHYVARFDHGVLGDYVFTTHQTIDADTTLLQNYFAGKRNANESVFGVLDLPTTEQVIRGRTRFVGWAVSSNGIRRVTLRFANGAVKKRAALFPREDVQAVYPQYPPSAVTGFYADLARPKHVEPATDVQVEIVDNAGRVVRLRDVWFTWLD